jgi:hypothetical protein
MVYIIDAGPSRIAVAIHNRFLRVVQSSGDKGGCQATKAGWGRLAVD